MNIQNITLISDADMGADIESATFPVVNAIYSSLQAVFTGSPVGSIKLQATVNSIGWDDITDSAFAISGPGTRLWNLGDIGYTGIKVFYTRTSGSGLLTVSATAKGPL